MEQNLYLKTKASTDSILTTNSLLHSISENNCMVLTNGAMTVKQCDFMTFIFKGLQIMVNNLNNTEVDEYMDFRDLDMEVKVQYIQQNRPFLKVDVDTILPFLKTTNTGKTRRVTKQEALDYIAQLNDFADKMRICTTINKGERIQSIQSIHLFSMASVDVEEEAGGLLNIKTFDLLINLDAVPYILTLFDYNDGYGHTQIQTILRLKSVHSKNLHYYICRYKTLINSNTGYKVNVSTLTKYLGINKLNRPYKQLIQIIDKYNKEMMDSGYELIVTPTKKGKKGQVLQIILKMQPIKQLKYTNNKDHSNCNKISANNNNRGDDWF